MRAGTAKGLFAALIGTALSLAAPATASATVESAQLGSTAAQLSYDFGASGYSNLRVKVIRGGTTFVDQPPAPAPGAPDLTGVGPAFAGRDPDVHVLQLDSSPDPEVVFDLFTGGAHCCFYSMIFSFSPAANSYSSIVHDWLDPGYQFADLDGDGISEFSSFDGRFAYAFGSFASSRFPPQIWRFSGGQLIDVTRQYPDIVRKDVRSERRNYKRVREKFDIRPPLAAFTADECLLGSCPRGFKLVSKAIKRGDAIVGSPGKFPGQLRKFLRKLGYL